MPFQKGHKHAKGRTKGSTNVRTRQYQEAFQMVLSELKEIRQILFDAEVTVYPEQSKIVETPIPEKPFAKVKAVETIPEKKTEPTRPRFITVIQQIEEARLLRLKNTK
jgi:hypothetical protein